MRPSDRLSLALLRMRITRALQEMRAACELWNLDAAQRAEQEMNDGLDQLGKRLVGRLGDGRGPSQAVG